MKFVISKDLEHSKLLNTLMMGVSLSLLFYLVFDVILHGFIVGSDIPTISNTLYGNVDEFIEPILLDTLLLQVHIDLFMSLLTLMILSTMYIRLFSEEKKTKWLIHLLFILGLVTPLMLLVAYMSSLFFVYMWILMLLAGHLLAIFFAVRIVKKLFSL